MGKFDAGQGSGRASERLETSHHRGASAFDRSMILLNEIVEVLVTSHLNILPLRILRPQKSKGQVARRVAIERDLARPARQTRRQSFAKECLRSCDAAIRAKQKIHRLAVSIDSAIKIIPLTTHVCFVHAPGSIHGPCEAVPSLLELRHIATHPLAATMPHGGYCAWPVPRCSAVPISCPK
jgi:hypothetical protein